MARPGRKVGACGEKTRELLITAATKEFSRYGYQGTKISSIVSQAGVSQPSFYLYFESKDAIFKELERLFRDRLQELAEKSRLEPEITTNEISTRISASLKNIFEFFLENKDLTRIGLFLSPESDQIKQGLIFQVTENLLAEQADGYFRPELNMAFVAETLIGAIMHVTETLLLPGKIEPEGLAIQIVDVFLYGLFHSTSMST